MAATGSVQTLERDLYTHIDDLGHGVFGVVDKVGRDGKVFARKKIRISTNRQRETVLKDVQTEFAILKRLHHPHIVEVVEMFEFNNRLCIIMSQVADTDLAQYLENIDYMQPCSKRDTLMEAMQIWPGCLIQAIDYMHEMRVKHRDLKPANILVMGNKVLITDFGVSKDLIDEETTACLTDRRPGSPMYWAPEVAPKLPSDPQRRGRAVDIYALGCIFLEMATILMAPPGHRRIFAEFREERNGTKEFRRSQKTLLQWIWCLGIHWHNYTFPSQQKAWKKDPHTRFMDDGAAVCDLAFFMLEPDPRKRITA